MEAAGGPRLSASSSSNKANRMFRLTLFSGGAAATSVVVAALTELGLEEGFVRGADISHVLLSFFFVKAFKAMSCFRNHLPGALFLMTD